MISPTGFRPHGVAFWLVVASIAAALANVLLLLQAAIIGPAYNVYAAWNHRRRAKSLT